MNTFYRPRLRRPAAVLFDWDDTLSDHAGMALKIFAMTAAQIGRQPPAPPEEMLRQWYENSSQCCKDHFPGCTLPELKKAYKANLDKMPLDEVHLLPDAEDTLKKLAAKGIPMAIVSNKPQERLRQEIEHLGVGHYFAAIIGQAKDTKTKPDPAPIVEAVKALKIPLADLWFVGDSIDDAMAARSDGLQRFILGNKHHALVQQRCEHNDPLGHIVPIHHLHELHSYIDRIPGPGSGIMTR
jgi:phosphoglycolate phosphatase